MIDQSTKKNQLVWSRNWGDFSHGVSGVARGLVSGPAKSDCEFHSVVSSPPAMLWGMLWSLRVRGQVKESDVLFWRQSTMKSSVSPALTSKPSSWVWAVLLWTVSAA